MYMRSRLAGTVRSARIDRGDVDRRAARAAPGVETTSRRSSAHAPSAAAGRGGRIEDDDVVAAGFERKDRREADGAVGDGVGAGDRDGAPAAVGRATATRRTRRPGVARQLRAIERAQIAARQPADDDRGLLWDSARSSAIVGSGNGAARGQSRAQRRREECGPSRARCQGSATAERFRPAAVAREHDRALRVQQVHLLDAFHRRDGLVGDAAGRRGHLGGDRRRGAEVRGRDLHHAAVVVRHQQVFLAVLLVEDHVERPVAGAELGDRRADDLRALEAVHRELHQRRAGVARDHVRLAVDRVGDEGVDRRAGLERAVVAVEDLDAGARVGGDERIRERAQLRRELFVREARRRSACR